jgi:Protein of unknown function (DUF732)
MRKAILASLAGALILLSGCTTGEPTPTVTVTATPTSVATPEPVEPTQSTTSAEDAFVRAFESEYGPLSSAGQASLIRLGHLVCQKIGEGFSYDDIVDAVNGGLDDYRTTGFVLGASVVAFCPEYRNTLESYIANLA